MIGLILVTHGKLAAEFLVALEHVVGPQKDIATICIGPHDDMEARRNEIAAAIKQVDSGKGAIILSDLFGGTPSNLAISLLESGRVEVIAGVNLPMLIRPSKRFGELFWLFPGMRAKTMRYLSAALKELSLQDPLIAQLNL
jgi:PTS system mannose-specific IIA component